MQSCKDGSPRSCTLCISAYPPIQVMNIYQRTASKKLLTHYTGYCSEICLTIWLTQELYPMYIRLPTNPSYEHLSKNCIKETFNTLHWVLFWNMLKDMAKRNRPTKFSAPHEFWKIGVDKLRMHCLFFSYHPLTCTPHAFYTLRVCTSGGINKIQRVVHCTVYVPRCCWKLMVGTPFIRVYNTPWLYVICDNWEQCSCIPVSIFYQKKKHPMAIHCSPSVNFDLDTWTPITAGWSMKYWIQMSPTKLYQSIAVADPICYIRGRLNIFVKIFWILFTNL